MSEEQRKDETEEVEGHAVRSAVRSANDEPTESDDDVEGHMRVASPRTDAPRTN